MTPIDEPTPESERPEAAPTEATPTEATPTEATPTEATPTEATPSVSPIPEPRAGEQDEHVPSSDSPELTFSDDELLGAAAWSWFGDTESIEDLPPDAFEPATPQSPGAPNADAPSQPEPPHAATKGVPPHSPPPPIRRLYRSQHDRKVAGVSAGLAEYFRVDPTIVRIITLATFFTGIGIFAYIAAWLIVPERPGGVIDPAGANPIASQRTMTIALGVAALAIVFGVTTGSWVMLSFALIAGGIWLLSEHTQTEQPSATEAPRPYEPEMAWSSPGASTQAASAAAVPPPSSAQRHLAPARPRRQQNITWTVLSLLALLAAVGVAAQSGGWWNVGATRLLGFGVVIIGIGVVVGQIRRGGARGLIPLGILAALALVPVSAVDGLLDEGVGESIHRPAELSELSSSYKHGIGTLTVDLSQLDFDGQSETIDIELGIGELIVIVSDDVGGQALVEATAGSISHETGIPRPFATADGFNVDSGTVQLNGSNGTVDLNISVGIGTAELQALSG